jgi:hypothetical protein
VGHFIDHLLTTASGPVVYLLVFLIPALEASLFVGFVLPARPPSCWAGCWPPSTT